MFIPSFNVMVCIEFPPSALTVGPTESPPLHCRLFNYVYQDDVSIIPKIRSCDSDKMSHINFNGGSYLQPSQNGIPLTTLPIAPVATNIVPSSVPVILSLNVITDRSGNQQVQVSAPLTLQPSRFTNLNGAQNIGSVIAGGTNNQNISQLQSVNPCRLTGLPTDSSQPLIQIGGVASQSGNSQQLQNQLYSILAPFVSGINSTPGAQTAPTTHLNNPTLANLLQLASNPSAGLINLVNSASNHSPQPCVSSSNLIHLANSVSSLASVLQQTNQAITSAVPQMNNNVLNLPPSLSGSLLDVLTVGPGNVLQLNANSNNSSKAVTTQSILTPITSASRKRSTSSETRTIKSDPNENEESLELKTKETSTSNMEILVSTDEVSSTTNMDSQTCHEVAAITARDDQNESASGPGQLDPESSAALSSVLELILKSPTMELAAREGTPLLHSAGESSSITTSQPETTDEVNINGLTQWMYCVDCNDYISNGCEQHPEDYVIVPDTSIPSRARLSMPYQVYFNKNLKYPGVWAKTEIAARTRYGPLVGELLDKPDTIEDYKTNPNIWQLFTTDGQCAKIIDCTDEDKSNWMIFVRKAEKESQQNIMVYQENDKIYFVTCKDILADTELRLWYSKNYALCLGLPQNPDDMRPCRQCAKECVSAKDLRDHIVTEHGRAMSKWQCVMCNRMFSSSTKLQNHVNTHMDMKPYQCVVCDKSFNDPSNLRMHIKIHTGDKRFECNICDKKFTQKAHLTMHRIVHTKEKLLSCEYCGKMFARKSDLKVHEYQHTKERIFVCEKCPKIFYKLQNYKRHTNTHLGVKDFACEECSKRFSTKFHLTRHEKSCKIRASSNI